jgi:hypothetical protein
VTRDAIDRRLETMLAGLPAATPDAARADRTRARGQARLAGQANRERRRRFVWKQVVAPALVGGFCVVYLAFVLYDAFRFTPQG